jgi:hypothetical protein
MRVSMLEYFIFTYNSTLRMRVYFQDCSLMFTSAGRHFLNIELPEQHRLNVSQAGHYDTP